MKKSGVVGLSLAMALLCAHHASAATITVNAGASLQAAIDAAQPGDTILVDPSGVFDGPIRGVSARPNSSCNFTDTEVVPPSP